MENREEIIKQTVTRLQSIKTLDEYKAAKEEILDMMEGVFKASLNALKDFFENIFSLEPEEKRKKSAAFQDEGFMFDPEITKELERLDSIPGAIEYSESFIPELQKRLEPYIEEIGKELHKLMDDTMGAIAGGMAEAVSSNFEEEADFPEYNPKNPDTPQMLYTLYIARNLDDVFVGSLIQYIEEEMNYNIQELKTFTDTDFGGITADDLSTVEKWRYNFNQLIPEMDKEFERLGALPDAAETALKIKKDILDKLAPTMLTLQEYLDKANEQAKELK